jgi:hypothetical protein
MRGILKEGIQLETGRAGPGRAQWVVSHRDTCCNESYTDGSKNTFQPQHLLFRCEGGDVRVVCEECSREVVQ